MTHRVCELLRLKIILNDLKATCEKPMALYCDNKSATSNAINIVQYDGTKYIELAQNFIKEKLDNGLITASYVPSGLRLSYMFTKGLPIERFHDLTCNL